MSTKADIVIDSATTFSVTYNLTDNNGDPMILTGFTVNAIMKRWYTSASFTTFTTIVNATAGTITLELDANTTANLYPGRYVYDIDMTDSTNTVSRVVEGIVTVTPSVTGGVFISNNNWANTNANTGGVGYTDG